MNLSFDYGLAYDSSGECDRNSPEIILSNIQAAFEGYVAPAIIVLGVIGNIASFFILGKLQDKVKRMKADYEQGTVVTIVFMRALAVFDLLTLLAKFVVPSCMVIYNIHMRRNQSLPFHAHVYFSPDSIFPFVQRITTPIGETMQTTVYWITMLLLFQRLDQKCASTAKSCCFVTRVGAGLLIFFVAMLCVGMNAQDLIFMNFETYNMNIPCTDAPAISYIIESSTEMSQFIPNQVAIGLRYAVPYVLMFLACFGIAITLCIERKLTDSSQLLLYWDMRLHLASLILGIILLLALGTEVSLRSCQVLSTLHVRDLMCSPVLPQLFHLLSNILNVVSCAIKFPTYFLSLRPYRQICACNTQDVSSDIGRAQYELYRYSLRREKRLL